MAVQLPSFPTIITRFFDTQCAMESLRVGITLKEIQYLRNKMGVDVNIIAIVCHLRNNTFMHSRLHEQVLRPSLKNRS
jgi:hypothetical protein